MPDNPRPRRRRRRVLACAAAVVLLAGGGGTAWALNRFVIDHVQVADVAAYEAAHGATEPTRSRTGTVSGDTYTSGDATVTVSRVSTGVGPGNGHLPRRRRDADRRDAAALGVRREQVRHQHR